MSSMNDNFSFNRFWAYFTKLLVERWQTNKMRLAILFGSIAMIELWIAFATYSKSSSSTDKAVDILLVVFVIVLFILGAMSASEMLSGAQRKAERISALTFPVTPFENWLARWIICIPLFLVCFLVCLYLADGLRVLLFGMLYPQIELKFIPLWGDSESTYNFAAAIWLSYFACTAIYSLGSVFFVKRALLKTTLSLFLLYWIMGFLPFFFIFKHSLLTSSYGESILIWYSWLSVLFVWWLSYLCFKDMEVVDSAALTRTKLWVVGYFVLTFLLLCAGALIPFSQSDEPKKIVEDRIFVYLDRTTEKRIAPVSIIMYDATNRADKNIGSSLRLAVEVNVVSDASQCSVIYPEQLITVKQKGDTLYYALSDSLEDGDFSRLEFLNGPDGDANSREADDIGQMPYLIKGADGKVRTAIDQNYTNDKKVRIIVNTLPGTLRVKQWGRQRTLLGAGDMKNVTVEGGDELILTSKVRVDNLTVKGKSSIDFGDAYINKMVLKSIGGDEYDRSINVNLKAGNKGLVNLMVINGSASVDGLTDVRCKRIELTPTKDRKMNMEIRGIWHKTVIQGNE